MTLISRFKNGAFIPLDGLKTLNAHKSLWLWVIFPWLINITLILTGWIFGVSILAAWVEQGMAWLLPSGSMWHSILYYPLLGLLSLGAMVLWVYTIFSVAALIAAPFYSLLAEKALGALGVSIPVYDTWMGRLGFLLRTLWIGIIKGIIFAFLGIIIFIGQLIPVANIFFAFAVFVILAFDCFDYSLEVMGWSLQRRFSWAGQRLPEMMGLACVLGLTLVIPGLTLLVVPLGIVGASRFHRERGHAAS